MPGRPPNSCSYPWLRECLLLLPPPPRTKREIEREEKEGALLAKERERELNGPTANLPPYFCRRRAAAASASCLAANKLLISLKGAREGKFQTLVNEGVKKAKEPLCHFKIMKGRRRQRTRKIKREAGYKSKRFKLNFVNLLLMGKWEYLAKSIAWANGNYPI